MKPFEIIGRKNKKHTLRMIVLAMGAWLALMAGGISAVNASCLDLADIPLDSLQQAAPGMIMFVMDDSGSMDWSIMCPPAQEGDGVFNGSYYVFPNPGDNQYSSGNLEESGNNMRWMSQWSGYNGLYYDPTTEYTPWPTLSDADVDNPKSNPMLTNTLDMTAKWNEWVEYGIIVDNGDATGFVASAGWSSSTGGYNNNYLYANGTETTVTATWTATGLDTSTTYDVYARWLNGGTSRLTDVHYLTYDNATLVADTGVNQQLNLDTWMPIATGITFSSGTGVVTISEDGGSSKVCADAVKFVPADNPISDIARRHYYVQNSNGTYLINMLAGNIEYYQVNLLSATDNREVVSADKLQPLTAAEAASAGIVTGRTYDEEIQNFANWYSFYRRRELTAKNAIAKVIDTTDGIFVGILFINNYNGGKDQRVLPVKVNLDGTFYDESATLLNILYNYQIDSYGTPLRLGLKKAGRFFRGEYLKPSTFIAQVNSDSYPYFKADKGGSCQQAFTIIFTDGYWNGGDPSVGNADGDGNTVYDGSPFGDTVSNTLADVAMYYYERDLNTTLANDVPITTVDPANHQHMVTYTVAFGVSGSLNTALYEDCPVGACPGSWPSTGSDSGKIDDMFHAAVNGRGKFISAKSTAELNAALAALKNDIDSRLGAAAALATNSIQQTVGSIIYQGTYNTSNWYGEVSALPLSVTTGAVGSAIWQASSLVPAWDARTILSYNGSGGIVFEAGNLSGTQTSQLTASGLGTAAELVDFIRGDTSHNVAHSGTLRTRTHILGDIVHSAPTYFKGEIYIGANDGMLHAFDATTGEEQFAYVPGMVYDHLADLADPGYTHKFYVDNTPTAANIGSQDLLVGGLGKGGKGYFALDVTNPAAMDPSHVLWEYPNGSDDDMGYSYSRAMIVNTQAEGYVVVFGNGYDSVNGEAVLYILEAETGTLLKQLKTGVAGCNGLSTPSVVDVDLNGVVEYAFAGDLKGNMWKFDLRGASKDDWTFSYMDGATPKPLVTVKNISGGVQPITAAPEVMLDCAVMDEGAA